MANTGSGKRSAGSSKPSTGSLMPLAQLVRLSLRLLRREARSGELTLIFFSLLLAMTLSTAISVFSARLDQAILDNAGDYLGAPLRVRSTEAFDEQWLKDAEEQGLRTAPSGATKKAFVSGTVRVVVTAPMLSSSWRCA